jgi:hypothetical protein
MALAQNRLDPQYLLNSLSRNLTHGLTGVNLRAEMPDDGRSRAFVNFDDFIPRTSTAAAIMVVGAAKGEDPSQAMMWTLMGFPLTTVAVPVWITADKSLPRVLSMKEDMHSPLCDAAMTLKRRLFPVTRGSGGKYMNVALLLNREKTGFLQRLSPVEEEIFARAAELTASMPERKSQRSEAVTEFYRWVDDYINQSWSDLFGLQAE